uniref:3-oxoacyl-acyl-carrier-protein synthase 3 Aic n=1 Tax=Rhizophora mucronata TaxID=61149 RepID=A0A2P2N7D1_RHIMU
MGEYPGGLCAPAPLKVQRSFLLLNLEFQGLLVKAAS